MALGTLSIQALQRRALAMAVFTAIWAREEPNGQTSVSELLDKARLPLARMCTCSQLPQQQDQQEQRRRATESKKHEEEQLGRQEPIRSAC